MTSEPCGKCPACVEIDEGRFVDYIEMDAASNRGVDDMAALLEKAAYAPSSARFKVYMIDEVHMLTTQAFNSMLKMLEEPPPHVKFILATTDPQKIPVTILSRCLQFNLKQMPVALIIEHLEKVLAAEKVSYEPVALRVLAKAAQGSMRDALSLTDQAIAYAAGTVNEAAVRGMLGTLDDAYLISMLDALAAHDGASLLAIAEEMGGRSMSFSLALQDLSSLLQKIAAAQVVPESVLDDWPEAAEIRRLVSVFTREEIQLFYQIAITSRTDISLAPDEQTGFAMALLRMLAFRPAGSGDLSQKTPPVSKPVAKPVTKLVTKTETKVAPEILKEAPKVSAAAPAVSSSVANNGVPNAGRPNWHDLMRQLPLRGLVQQMAFQTDLQDWTDSTQGIKIIAVSSLPQLATADCVERLREVLATHFAKPVRLEVVGGVVDQSVAKIDAQVNQERRLNAEEQIATDPLIKELEKQFGAKVVSGSVRPL
ncbi:MAG: DNA polymerase III subunit gamma/tau [Polynucleobacter sp.]|nr:DNA polymerase III subunit gamma/tau [Polynucleobacter sp.]